MSSALELSNQRFGKLVALHVAQGVKGRGRLWLCQCECGRQVEAEARGLKAGLLTSCGCVREKLEESRVSRSRRYFNGDTRKATPEYVAYLNARKRCTRKRANHGFDAAFQHYGGRGIQFLFRSFDEFYAALGPRLSDEHSLDRIDNNGHYEPGNVRWATWNQQAANRRTRRWWRKPAALQLTPSLNLQ